MLTFAPGRHVTYLSNTAGFVDPAVRSDGRSSERGGVFELMGVNLSINRLPLYEIIREGESRIALSWYLAKIT